MTNTKLAKLRLPIIKLTKSIEINHNAKFLAQFQKIKKIFQCADQQNQQLPMKTKNLITIKKLPMKTKNLITIKKRNTLHIAKALLS